MVTDLLTRTRAILRRRTADRDLDDELAFHVQARTAQLIESGVAPREAARIARVEFGGVDQIAEECRDARGVRIVSEFAADLEYAARQLRRSPGFALLVIVCLGFGIGVNTTMFSVLNALLFRPMPVADPAHLVLLRRGPESELPYDAVQRLSEGTRSFSDLAISMPMESDIDVDGSSRFAAAEAVSGNYGATFGVPLAAGRWFSDDREPSAVISHAVWQRYFNLDPRAIGSTIRSESQVYTIVGVAPPAFSGVFAPMRSDIWVPIRTRPSIAPRLEERPFVRVMAFGRLRGDTTVAQATADVNTVDASEPPADPTGVKRAPLALEDFRGVPNLRMRTAARSGGVLLMLVAALVLGVACLNVGNLLLVRGAARGHEVGIRRALGASRGRIVRQLLTETFLLALCGALAGVAFAAITARTIAAVLPQVPATFAMQMDFAVDGRVLAFAAIVSAIAVLICGLRPAWLTSRGAALRSRAGTLLSYRRPFSVVAQVTLSLVLLVVCGMFVRTLLVLQSTNPGFATANRLYAFTYTPSPSLDLSARRQFYEHAVGELERLPGVSNVAVTETLPLLPSGSTCLASGATTLQAPATSIDAGYISTMGIPLVRGRRFDATDRSDSAPVVIVSEALERRVWPNGGAVGSPVTIGCTRTGTATVVGVVRDAAVARVGEEPQPHMYLPFTQAYAGGVASIVVQTAGPPGAMAEPMRRTLRGLGQDLRIYQLEPLADYVDRSYAALRWSSSVLALFGATALILAAFGLFGVIAYRVTLRTREIGVRMAIGATRIDVLRHVMRWGLTIVVVGIAIGELLTVPLARVVTSLQVGARPPDLATHATVVGIWLLAGLLGCLAPALRATAINPSTALRDE